MFEGHGIGARLLAGHCPSLSQQGVTVLAIQAVDGERAVDAMDTLRSLMTKYRPDLSRS